MINLDLLPPFIGLVVMVMLTPGPDMVFIVSTSMASGCRGGVYSVLGVASGAMMHTIFVAFGLAAILQASQTAFLVIKVAGAGYLFYLGVKAILSKTGPLECTGQATRTNFEIYKRGFLTNLMNPKALIFCGTFYPQFVDPSLGHPQLQIITLGLILVAIMIVMELPIAFSSGKLGERLLQNRIVSQWMNKITGVIFIGLGSFLIAEERPQ